MIILLTCGLELYTIMNIQVFLLYVTVELKDKRKANRIKTGLDLEIE